MDDAIKVPHWYKIVPEIIGSNYNRFQIIKKVSATEYTVFVKMPCSGMDGCDRCSGPHRKGNKKCSKNLRRPPYISGPPKNYGGIFLYDIFSGVRLNGIWVVENERRKDNSRSALATLCRK
jgi:hypothetical protein